MREFQCSLFNGGFTVVLDEAMIVVIVLNGYLQNGYHRLIPLKTQWFGYGMRIREGALYLA